jgi:MerR family Zn(II)-responsive transcriptional regulator of zntA
MERQDELMNIGAVAKATGLATSALRYYEQEGLLTPTMRSEAGYRLYDGEAVERVRFIRSAQGVGFNLDDIRRLLDLERQGAGSCQADVQGLLERRLAQVDKKMRELKRVRTALGRALDRCRRSNGECAVISEISPRKNNRRRP